MPGGPGVRIDTHAYAGYKIPPYYDSLLAKLITYGETREEAIVRMLREARGQGANVVWNVRIATSTIAGQRQAAGVEVLAYGTAMRVDTA